MPGFGKIYSSTYTGSMYGSGAVVFALWGYVLAHAWDGLVEINPPMVAGMIGTPVDAVEDALVFLCGPDPDSRNPEEEGRRLVKEGAFTYRVVSWEKYHLMRNDDHRRAQNNEAQARHRAKEREGDPPPQKPVENATKPKPPADPLLAIVEDAPVRIKAPLVDWLEYRKEKKLQKYTEKGLRQLVAHMEKLADPAAAVAFSMRQNYQGLFEEGRGPAKNGQADLTVKQKYEADMAEIKRRRGFDDQPQLP